MIPAPPWENNFRHAGEYHLIAIVERTEGVYVSTPPAVGRGPSSPVRVAERLVRETIPLGVLFGDPALGDLAVMLRRVGDGEGLTVEQHGELAALAKAVPPGLVATPARGTTDVAVLRGDVRVALCPAREVAEFIAASPDSARAVLASAAARLWAEVDGVRCDQADVPLLEDARPFAGAADGSLVSAEGVPLADLVMEPRHGFGVVRNRTRKPADLRRVNLAVDEARVRAPVAVLATPETWDRLRAEAAAARLDLGDYLTTVVMREAA